MLHLEQSSNSPANALNCECPQPVVLDRRREKSVPPKPQADMVTRNAEEVHGVDVAAVGLGLRGMSDSMILLVTISTNSSIPAGVKWQTSQKSDG